MCRWISQHHWWWTWGTDIISVIHAIIQYTQQAILYELKFTCYCDFAIICPGWLRVCIYTHILLSSNDNFLLNPIAAWIAIHSFMLDLQIPTDLHPVTQKSALETVLTVLLFINFSYHFFYCWYSVLRLCTQTKFSWCLSSCQHLLLR